MGKWKKTLNFIKWLHKHYSPICILDIAVLSILKKKKKPIHENAITDIFMKSNYTKYYILAGNLFIWIVFTIGLQFMLKNNASWGKK